MRKQTTTVLGIAAGAVGAGWLYSHAKATRSLDRVGVDADDDSGSVLDNLAASIRRGFGGAYHPQARAQSRPQAYSQPRPQTYPQSRPQAYPQARPSVMHAPYHPGGGGYGYEGGPLGIVQQFAQQFGQGFQRGYGPQQGYSPQQGYGPQRGYPRQSPQQPVTYTPTPMPGDRPSMTSSHPTPHETSANFSEDRGATPIARTGKFISKMFGGPPSTPQGGIDDQLLRTQRGLNYYYGHKLLKEDGIMGDNSRRVLIQFQHDTELPETGKADGATYDLITRLAERKHQDQVALATKDHGVESADATIQPSNGNAPTQPVDRSKLDWGTGLKETALFWALPPPLTVSRLMHRDHVAEDAAAQQQAATKTSGWYDAFTPPGFPWEAAPPALFGNSGFGGYGYIGQGGPQGLGGYGSWGSFGGWGHGF